MKFYALFNYDPKDNIVNELGYNLNQRLYYKRDLVLLDVNHDFSYLGFLWKQARSGQSLCIVSERSYHSVFAFLFKFLFKNVKWIYDTPDCPYKETYRHKPYTLNWFKSYIKAKVVYLIIPYADLLIINYHSERFNKFYKGPLIQVHFFKNAIPDLTNIRVICKPDIKQHLNMIYVGSNLPNYGLNTAFEAVKRYNSKAKTMIKIHIYGHSNPKNRDVNVLYHGIKSLTEIKIAIENADICIAPLLRGTDIEYAYPIKNIEYFSYGKKILLSDTIGQLSQFTDIDSKDVYFANAGDVDDFFEKITLIVKDISNGIFDKKRNLDIFSAEKKNQMILSLYEELVG